MSSTRSYVVDTAKTKMKIHTALSTLESYRALPVNRKSGLCSDLLRIFIISNVEVVEWRMINCIITSLYPISATELEYKFAEVSRAIIYQLFNDKISYYVDRIHAGYELKICGNYIIFTLE